MSAFFPPFSFHSVSVCRGTSASRSMASSKVVAEYAKSSRSSCNKCSKAISAHSLRLGLVRKHPRGFDATSWHHLDCFPVDLELASSVDAIKGFSELESCDKEAIKRTVDGYGETKKDNYNEHGADVMEAVPVMETVPKRNEIYKSDKHEDVKETSSKRIKPSAPTEETKPVILFSLSDIKDTYKDAQLLPKWKAFETIIFLEWDGGIHDSAKIAAFDFDGCLARTSVKRVGADAWSLMHKSIPDKLQSLYSDGYKLVIFTNESNIERWKNKRQVAVDSKIGRLKSFIEQMKLPIQVFIACGTNNGKMEDPYRKPKTGMWQIMEQHFNSGISIDMDRSFYVGDAAGRPNDHGDADIKFAEALGLSFFVPEEYFGM